MNCWKKGQKMKIRYKIGILPKTLIGMDILAGVLNFINWILDFNILRLELALI